ncbi:MULTISPECIES: phage tail protein I [unclassified Halomonas]|uniref:phage tail protein I n=1 Tax=unclassified Halomonas TaxID=2609666 RepID=UPI0004AD1795|nr:MULTISPECIES: phage tail protein I [unclassified Halomonas]PKH63472.1 phage tail protein I [Halomonas sp. Choline-3u-9]QGQ69827.1 phage tail protein I [Halomonas sp. PA16-9]
MPTDDRRPLLPPNATFLERAAAEALAEIQRVPIPLRDLIDPWRCPARLLPHLAWSCSIDRWDAAWSERTKRQVIADSFYIHAHKGTLGALKRVVEPFGYVIGVVEWWQEEPPGPRGTFALRIGVEDRGIDEQTYWELERLIDDARPLTRPLAGLSVEISTDLALFGGVITHDGDLLDVWPWQPSDIDVAMPNRHAIHSSDHDIMEVSIHG